MKQLFEPHLKPPRDRGRSRNLRFSRMVLDQAGKAGRSQPGRQRTGGPRFGRGGSAPVLVSGQSFVPGSRRVIVKARIVRHQHPMTAAKAHLRYIQRDGVTRDGEAGTLYSRDHDDADGNAFLVRSDGERHQFRLIIAAEDGAKLADLKPFIRDLMAKMEEDLGAKLDWVAVDHHNTGHPHTHVVIRGRDDRGRDLVIAKSYITHGIRAQAQRLVSLELGPETQIERLAKLKLETAAPRLTRIDRSISREAKENIWVFDGRGRPARQMRSVKIARLKALERLGLAAERRAGVFEVDPQMVNKLQNLGIREERYATAQRTLKEAGLTVRPSQVSLWSAAGSEPHTQGVVVGCGLVDEGGKRHYLVLRSENGRIVYAEFNMTPGHALPDRGAKLSLVPGRSPEIAVVKQTKHGRVR
jgi:type IV secretory pathway VirD2 relaxase